MCLFHTITWYIRMCNPHMDFTNSYELTTRSQQQHKTVVLPILVIVLDGTAPNDIF